jgi:peptidoglycan L-alanyl-D-glutamate endopeptidase CwlK
MAKHIQGPHCPLCEEKIKTAHEAFEPWWRLVKTEFPDCHISWGFRNKYHQDLAYQEGRSRVQFPDSLHNATRDGKPCARALDFFRIRQDHVPEWNKTWFRAVALFLEKAGSPLEWGGDWTRFVDFPHFQLPKTIKQEKENEEALQVKNPLD